MYLAQPAPAERYLCSAIAAHSVNASTRWRRGGAEEEIACAGLVGEGGRTQEELLHCHRAPADISPEQIRVHSLENRRC